MGSYGRAFETKDHSGKLCNVLRFLYGVRFENRHTSVIFLVVVSDLRRSFCLTKCRFA